MNRYNLLVCIVLFVLSWGMVAWGAAAAPSEPNVSRENPLSVLFGQDAAAQITKNLEAEMATASIIMGLLAVLVSVSTLVWCHRIRVSVARLKKSGPQADVEERLATLGREAESLNVRVDHLRQSWEADTGKLGAAVRQWEDRITWLEQSGHGLDSLRDAQNRVESTIQQWEERFAAQAKDLDSLRDAQNTVDSIFRQLESRIAGLEQGLRDSQHGAESVVQQLQNRIAGLEEGHQSFAAAAKDLDSLRDFRNHVEQIHVAIQRAFNGGLPSPSSPMPLDEGTLPPGEAALPPEQGMLSPDDGMLPPNA